MTEETQKVKEEVVKELVDELRLLIKDLVEAELVRLKSTEVRSYRFQFSKGSDWPDGMTVTRSYKKFDTKRK